MAPYVTSLDVLDARFSSLKDPRDIWILGAVAIFVCHINMMLFLTEDIDSLELISQCILK